ncbi:MAG: glycosyltransferase family 2 protein [Lachnospiraceae bacterium]|nr:glycosyltransferase family 2 protein [Lachnospiraceae bacterium]
MKKISICVPCYNEEANIENMYNALKKEAESEKDYTFEFIFPDNASKDSSREVLKKIASQDDSVKVIINRRNYGPKRSNYNAFFRATGDAIITLACDFQDPPSMIHPLLREWEKGNLVVFGQKTNAKENFIMHSIRTLYYKIIKYFSSVKHYEHVSSLFLLDKEVVDTVKAIDDFEIDVHHLIEDLGYGVVLVPYTHEKRAKGKSSYNFIRYFDFAITELVNTSYFPLRIATFFGFISSFISFVVGMVYFVYKLIFWNTFNAGAAPIVIGLFLLGSIQITFLGIIGEYIGVIMRKLTKRPVVLEEETINFSGEKEEANN